MGIETRINKSSLEKVFREQVKQYRALLRWGVDKVFEGNKIDNLFHDVKSLLDAKENDKASNLLSELKSEINKIEDQYPVQKTEIENKLLAKIQQLETLIEKTTNIDLKQNHDFFKTLEIARVAMQNDDWPEAQTKIESVEVQVNKFQAELKAAEEKAAQEKAEKEKAAKEKAEKERIEKEKIAAEKKQIAEEKRLAEEKQKQEAEAQRIEIEKQQTAKEKELAEKQLADASARQSSLGPVANKLLSTEKHSTIGKLVDIKGLQQTFQMLDMGNTKNLRIGFIADAKIIDTNISSYSKKALHIGGSDKNIPLIRLAISRELTIYLVGLPFDSGFEIHPLKNIATQFSALFIDTQDIAQNDIEHLSKTVTELATAVSDKIFIKDHNQSLIDNKHIDNLKSIHTDNAKHTFIEDAAFHLTSFSSDA